MKKTYKAPAIELYQMFAEQMVAASITDIGGDVADDLDLGTGETPEEADVKGNYYGSDLFD